MARPVQPDGDGDEDATELSLSQESLPMSQGTFQALWGCVSGTGTNELSDVLNNQFEGFLSSDVKEENLDIPSFDCIDKLYSAISQLQVPQLQTSLDYGNSVPVPDVPQQNLVDSSNLPYPSIGTQPLPSPIPAVTNWAGCFGFSISFELQEKTTKSTAWTYSDSRDKLYATMGSACPVRIHVQSPPPPNFTIRAMAVFMKPEHVTQPVKRCLTHAVPSDPSNQGHPAPRHFIRSEAPYCNYVDDPETGRQSVVVSYEAPSAGMAYTTYLYKFMCLGSCVGGLNRRPVQVVFTLEKDNVVLGRRALEVRICACPGRDRRADEKQGSVREKASRRPSQEPCKQVSGKVARGSRSESDGPPSKKTKGSSSEEECYTLKIYEKENYKLLKTIYERLRCTNPPATKTVAVQCSPESVSKPNAAAQKATKHCFRAGSVCTSEAPLPITVKTENAASTSVDADDPGADHDRPVASWLQEIGMIAYIGRFKERGLKTMDQLNRLTVQDLCNMNIVDKDCNKLWMSLIQHFLNQQKTPSCGQTSPRISHPCQDDVRHTSLRKRKKKNHEECCLQVSNKPSACQDHDYADGTY